MRVRLLVPALLLACRPARIVEPGPAVAPVAVPAAAPAPAPAPAEPVARPEPVPTWEWAVSVVPELARHSEVDPAEAALARFVGWFGAGRSGRVYVLDGGACHGIAGTMGDDGFHGRWQTKVSVRGGEKQVSGMNLEITRGGISESGPGGTIYRRDARGRWIEAGGFGTGHFHTLVDDPMSAADEHSLTFGGYWYGLAPVCQETESITRTCIGAGPPRCDRCTRVWLKPQARHMGASGTLRVGRVDPTPVDCTQPCPVDEWTPLLPRLAAALAGRQFAGVMGGERPVVFRSAGGCARERRLRIRAEAAARAAEQAEASGDPG